MTFLGKEKKYRVAPDSYQPYRCSELTGSNEDSRERLSSKNKSLLGNSSLSQYLLNIGPHNSSKITS
ncbi:hypothetical protein RRG08_058907 [Elysia crispata]|uniref:Uncharacterized protein n=1 Tax=Elysia crispata TaxID=231223 RepID=A0AAE0ZEN5_9GAST|nr:hypothetical protein RRG08_058907 [Elysia crispata]